MFVNAGLISHAYPGCSSDTSLGAVTIEARHSLHNRLVKQTYSVFVETRDGRKKWHLSAFSAPQLPSLELTAAHCMIAAYFVPSTVNHLRTVDDMPQLANLQVPDGMYTSAKIGKGRAREPVTADIHGGTIGTPHIVVSRPYINVPQQYTAYVAYSNETMQTPSPASSNGSPVVQTPGPMLQPLSQLSPRTGQWRDDTNRQSLSSRTLPYIVPPSGMSPISPITGSGVYSPRHPLDNEALRQFNKPV